MGGSEGYAAVGLPQTLCAEVDDLIDRHPSLGYRSRLEFCASAVRDKLPQTEARARQILDQRQRGMAGKELRQAQRTAESGPRTVVPLPKQLCRWVDDMLEQVPELGYPSRSEFCAAAVRDKLQQAESQMRQMLDLRERLVAGETDKLRALRDAQRAGEVRRRPGRPRSRP